MSKKIATVLIAYNNHEIIEKTIMDFYATKTIEDNKLFIVDNHSKDPLTHGIIRLYPDATVFDPGENIGHQRGFKFAMDQIGKDYQYLVLLDDDVRIDTHGWDSKLVEVMDQNPNMCFLSPESNVSDGHSAIDDIVHDFGTYKIRQTKSAIVVFGLILFNVEKLLSIRDHILTEFLYGGFESSARDGCLEKGYLYGYLVTEPKLLISHPVHEEGSWLYKIWKFCYGSSWTTESYENFSTDIPALIVHLAAYERWNAGRNKIDSDNIHSLLKQLHSMVTIEDVRVLVKTFTNL